ncbi:MAG: hypothetical protein AB7I38_10925 [Dehalococcoidia bacterium]
MTSPSLVSITNTPFTTSAASYVLDTPAVDAGDRLIAVLVVYADRTAGSAPANWTNILADTRFHVYERIYSTSASASTVTLTHTGSNTVALGRVIRISGSHATDASTITASGSVASGTNANPDPPDLNPAVSKDWLWLAIAEWSHFFGSDRARTAVPTNYTATTDFDIQPGSGELEASIAYRALTASSENPGTFTLDGSAQSWRAITIAVPPGGVAHSGAASLAAVAAVTAAGRRGALGVASMAATASVTAAGRRGALASASLAGVGSMTAAGSVGLRGATSLAAVALVTATPDNAKLGAASLAATAAVTASAMLTLQGAAAIAAAAALTAAASAGRGGVASLSATGSVTAAGSVGLEGAASLSGIAVLTASGSIVVFFDIGLNARPRLYIHDGETLRRLVELTEVSSINRDFALREKVRHAEFDIAWSHPDGALTDDERGHVLVIDSPEYPSPWVGRIVERRANHPGRFWTVQAESYEAILGERVLDTEFATSRGRASTVARQILARVNGINDTGIEMGDGADTIVPPLALANILGIEALERLAENAGMEWWLSYRYDAGAVRVLLNVGRERGNSFYDRVVLRQPGNFEIADSRSSNRNRVYATTVVGGQASPSTTFAERERSVAVRDSQFARGDSSVGVHIVEGDRLTRHGHVIGGESGYRAPTQRRERLLVLEELKAQGTTREVAEARLTRARPPRSLVGRAYPDVEGTLASTWKYLEPGNVLHLVSDDAFGVGYDGPAVIAGVQPMEHERFVELVLEVG